MNYETLREALYSLEPNVANHSHALLGMIQDGQAADVFRTGVRKSLDTRGTDKAGTEWDGLMAGVVVGIAAVVASEDPIFQASVKSLAEEIRTSRGEMEKALETMDPEKMLSALEKVVERLTGKKMPMKRDDRSPLKCGDVSKTIDWGTNEH